MRWYTLSDGRLCLGAEKKVINFHVATDIQLDYQVDTPLTSEHIQMLGIFPEDWLNDDDIESKINALAKRLYEFDPLAELNIINDNKISEESINQFFAELKSQVNLYNKVGFSQISAFL